MLDVKPRSAGEFCYFTDMSNTQDPFVHPEDPNLTAIAGNLPAHDSRVCMNCQQGWAYLPDAPATDSKSRVQDCDTLRFTVDGDVVQVIDGLIVARWGSTDHREQQLKDDVVALSRSCAIMGKQLDAARAAHEAVVKHGNETLEELRALRRLDAATRRQIGAVATLKHAHGYLGATEGVEGLRHQLDAISAEILLAISDVNTARGVK